jgi:hypothetical protein
MVVRNGEVLLADMAIMGHSLLEASTAMVNRNRAGQLSLVESIIAEHID